MDHRILQQLYERYGREIYLYLYSLCRNHSTAEDLLQETFLKVILSLSESHTNMRAWLYLVARNLCFNRMKGEKRLYPLEQITDEVQLANDSPDLLEHFIADERRKQLYLALSELPRQKREILNMQYFGKLSQREIADILNLTPENVRVLSYRAKKELKSLMEAKGYDLS